MNVRRRIRGFTMLELIATVAIIFVLAGLLMAGASMARRAARIQKTNATLDALAAACDEYYAAHRSFPYPHPDAVGSGSSHLGDLPEFRASYYDGGWTYEAYNVAFCWLMSKKRNPAPFISLQQKWYKKAGENLVGPDNRDLFRVLDGFDHYIRVERPSQYYDVREYIKFISAGPDEDFGTDDDIERYLKR